MPIDLTKIKPGASGTVVSLQGGRGFTLRLTNLGIRPGVKITKLNAHFWRGPITVRLGRANLALGFGMASKIMVELDTKNE
ncbi:MAG: ferrous iron transport protein A [Candidatus Omnitrophica bacterium]|nr:ferrous iron transport protein A [Candidatus Omnitrophota bacterium]